MSGDDELQSYGWQWWCNEKHVMTTVLIGYSGETRMIYFAICRTVRYLGKSRACSALKSLQFGIIRWPGQPFDQELTRARRRKRKKKKAQLMPSQVGDGEAVIGAARRRGVVWSYWYVTQCGIIRIRTSQLRGCLPAWQTPRSLVSFFSSKRKETKSVQIEIPLVVVRRCWLGYCVVTLLSLQALSLLSPQETLYAIGLFGCYGESPAPQPWMKQHYAAHGLYTVKLPVLCNSTLGSWSNTINEKM